MATYCCDAANSYAICSLRRSTKPVAAIASHPNRPAAALPAGCAVTMRAMATCLVTGGAGFLGSHLCDELLRREHRVICVDNLETGSLANIEHIRSADFLHVNLDIIEPYFVDEPIDFVYH